MGSTGQRVNLLFRSTIDQMKASGVDLAPEDVVALWGASQRCIKAGIGETALLEVPVQVGPLTLWPRTIGAGLWWKKYGSAWFGGDTEDEVLALGWMLAHSRDAGLFRRTVHKSQAVARLLAWQIGLPARVTMVELAYGISRVFEQYDVDAVTGERFDCAAEPDWGGVVAQLCATYHRRPEYFLWGIGERAVMELLEKTPPPPGVSRASEESRGGFEDFVAFKKRLREKYAVVEA